uniref:Stimulator of interferon genes protein n=1 Tax=Crassostrea virginica TaxID=6565 RepID=A0A8B8E7L6_CRAVI|nr:stimulator of interferon genes protein-like isoform X3 [Crassostrea virginica]
MSVPVLRHSHKYHAFISYCADTDTSHAKRILEAIERRDIKCFFGERDFMPGGCRADEIVEAIHLSKNVILVISPASLQSEWSKFEMLMAVDDSHKRNTVCLVPVLVGGVNVVDLPAPLRPLTCIELKEDLQNIEEIIRAISKPEDTWETLLPVGNLAHGFAWGYYYGYLKIILPELDKRVRDWRRENKVEGRMSEKTFLLLPQSCRCKDSISDESPLIKHRGHLPILTQNRAGVIERQYKNSIYSILDEEENEEYYFVGEYIGVIHTMYLMEQNASTGLQTQEKYIQTMRFYLTLRRILDTDLECSSKYKILYYKDQSNRATDGIPQLILKAIKTQIQKESSDECVSLDNSLLSPVTSISGPEFAQYSILNPGRINNLPKHDSSIQHRDANGQLQTCAIPIC